MDEPSDQMRVIASTRHDLERGVREGRFREDLYYRLGVITIDVPPLAEHKGDIPLLVERVLERLNRRGDRTVKQVAPEAARILQAHDYPGNVRELENVVEHAFVVGQGPVLKPEHFPSYILRASALTPTGELARRAPNVVCLALHPGTVDTDLSRPFQGRVPPERLFDRKRAADQLLGVIEAARPEQSGSFLAWDGQVIPW